jgi:hypothetical protein
MLVPQNLFLGWDEHLIDSCRSRACEKFGPVDSSIYVLMARRRSAERRFLAVFFVITEMCSLMRLQQERTLPWIIAGVDVGMGVTILPFNDLAPALRDKVQRRRMAARKAFGWGTKKRPRRDNNVGGRRDQGRCRQIYRRRTRWPVKESPAESRLRQRMQ